MASLKKETDKEDEVYDEKKRDIVIKEFHQKGLLDEDGLTTETGEFIPRAKREKRLGLSEIQEYEISQWVKQMCRDFPHIDPGLADLIATHVYLHPEESEAFVKDRLANPPPKKNHEEYFKGLGHEKIDF